MRADYPHPILTTEKQTKEHMFLVIEGNAAPCLGYKILLFIFLL